MADDLFTLDDETLATVENGIDTLIRQLGKQCKLIYEGEQSQCPNCNFDSTFNRSTNIYNGVGPKPFNRGRCPVCHGTGYLPGGGITSEVVTFLIDWQPKPWQWEDPRNTEIRYPAGLVQTKGFVVDLPKVLQAKYIIVDYLNAVFENNRFVRWNEPVLQGNIVKSKYFIAFWQRFQG